MSSTRGETVRSGGEPQGAAAGVIASPDRRTTGIDRRALAGFASGASRCRSGCRAPLTSSGAGPRTRDGRGLTVAARGTVVRTLGHVESAVRRSDGQGGLGHKARGFLKSLVHIDDFDETAERGSRFFGEILKAGRRRASATPVCEAQAHVCGEMSGVGEIRLCREVSVAGLRQVGRELGLCVAHANEVGRPYHTELKKGESEFWSLRSAAGSFALLSVRIEEGERCVAEFEGRNGKRPVVTDENRTQDSRLSGALLRNVLRKLKAERLRHRSLHPCGSVSEPIVTAESGETIATYVWTGATFGSGASRTKSSSRRRGGALGWWSPDAPRSGHDSSDVNGGAWIGYGGGGGRVGDEPSGNRALGTTRRWTSVSCLSC